MKTILKIVCMYCGQFLGEKDGLGAEGTTASICEKCWQDNFPELPYLGNNKTCNVCGCTGPEVHEWPTYKDGRDRTEYQCDDYKACLNRKHNQRVGVK